MWMSSLGRSIHKSELPRGAWWWFEYVIKPETYLIKLDWRLQDLSDILADMSD
jgi:hypothetical protein